MLKHEDVTEKILKTFYDVYNELGHGFLESVYQESMLMTLREAGFEVERQKPIPVHFRGKKVGVFFADLVINDLVVLELKAARTIERIHEAQLRHHLKATEMEIGLLLNFGDSPQFRRVFLDNEHKRLRGSPKELLSDSLEKDPSKSV